MSKPETDERVDIIASGYEWICPSCDEFNKVIGHSEIVTCKCGKSFYTEDPDHARG